MIDNFKNRHDAFIRACKAYGTAQNVRSKFNAMDVDIYVEECDIFEIAPVLDTIWNLCLHLLGLFEDNICEECLDNILENICNDSLMIDSTDCEDIAEKLWTAYARK